jgi:hypothetical protein
VVTVPGQVEDSLALVKPYTVRFYLSWTDENNKQQKAVLPLGSRNDLKMKTSSGTSDAKTIYTGDPGRLNVFDLGEVNFPACYYGLAAYPSLMMSQTENFVTPAQKKSNDQQLRVAGVYLVPKQYNDMWANSVNE